MRTHHARLSNPCRKHGPHVCHLISRDDEAWVLARLLATKMAVDGLEVECETWLEGDDHVRRFQEGYEPLDWGIAPWDLS